MHRIARTSGPRLVVAGLWTASMFISWAVGSMMIGFDFGTTLIWLIFFALGPLLVWAFVTIDESKRIEEPAPRARARARRPLKPVTREFKTQPAAR